MALIKSVDDKRVSVKAKVLEKTLTEVNQYMQWAGVKDVSDFVEQSIQYVLENDKEWKRHKHSV